MSHYYDAHPDAATDEKEITYAYQQHQLHLTTDAGVFSRDQVDFGSDLLVHTFLNAHPPGQKKTIVDVGCGYGPIGLMLAKSRATRSYYHVRCQSSCIRFGRENAQRNQLSNVTIQESDGLSQVANETQHYVVTNPPIRAGKQVVHQIFVDAHRVLEANGELYVVIQKKQGMPSAKKKWKLFLAMSNQLKIVRAIIF
ncbi:methyltransferase [Staphylococcus pseudintermedius]